MKRLLPALVLGLLACREIPSSEPDCQRTCERLDACGFLPSPIAPGDSTDGDLVESCTERCVESDPVLVESVHACAAVVRPESPARWCGGRSKMSACDQAQSCMLQVAKSLPITGEVELRLQARIGRTREHAPQTKPPQQACTGSDEPDEAEPVLALSSLCDRHQLDEVEYFVIQAGQEVASKRRGCAAGLERGAEFVLRPGPVTAGIQLRSTISVDVAQDDGSVRSELRPTCITYYAAPRILKAGTAPELPIYLPENRPPLTPEACPSASAAEPDTGG